MKTEQAQIHEFMSKAGQATPPSPIMPNSQVRALRLKLIAEELLELAEAFGYEMEASNLNGTKGTCFLKQVREPNRPEPNKSENQDLIDAYDAILDLLVVVVGAGAACGTDLQPGWDEVHRSNMSKFIDGHRGEDGKWIKGPAYSPANLRPIIEAQILSVKTQPDLKIGTT